MFDLRELPSHDTMLRFASSYPDLDISALESWLTMLRTASDELTAFDEFLAEYGVSQTKFFVLLLLKRHPDGLTPSRLAQGVAVSPPTMTGIVDRLARDGLVERIDIPTDRRSAMINLTDAGKQLMDTLLPPHYARIASLFAVLSEAERQTLQTLMGKLRLAAHDQALHLKESTAAPAV